MMNTQTMKTATEYIKESWIIYSKKENFIYFAKIMAVITIFSLPLALLTSYLFPENYLRDGNFSNVPMLISYIAISIASIIVGLWSQTTQYYAIFKIGKPEKEILKQGFKNMLRFLLISFVVGVIVVFGAILLIIPAIIFGVWYSFSTFLVLDKEIGVFEALKSSKQMVKGKFWKIFGRSIVFGLFAFLVSAIISSLPYIGAILISFVTPLFLLPSYLMYKDLSVNN